MTFKHAGAFAATLILGGVALAPQVLAQEPQPLPEIEPPPRPITVWVAERPTVTLTFQGESGISTLVGTLESAPQEKVRITDSNGLIREVPFTDISGFSLVRQPFEGLPAGTYTVGLFSRLASSLLTGTPNTGADYSGLSDPQQENVLRANRLPAGDIVLSGQPYGRIAVPLSRVLDMTTTPITARLAELPAGTVRVEVLPGKTVDVPLRAVEGLYRDLQNGTVTLQLNSELAENVGQTISGKLLELPQVTLELGEAPNRQSVALSRVVALQRPSLTRRL
ncbi:MAG TPA: hypothetical protein VFU47_13995 [Armatimonadota bacterium]|nr:hypothetical protein [Armatimonadota bacterium]